MHTDDTYVFAVQTRAASMTKGYGVAWRVKPGTAMIQADYVPATFETEDLAEWEAEMLTPCREIGSIMWDGEGGVYAVIIVPGAARIVECDDVTDAIRVIAKTAVDMRFGRF